MLLVQPTVIRHNALIVGAFGHIIADDDAVLVAAIVLTMFKPFFDCRLHLRSSTRCPHTNDQQSVFLLLLLLLSIIQRSKNDLSFFSKVQPNRDEWLAKVSWYYST